MHSWFYIEFCRRYTFIHYSLLFWLKQSMNVWSFTYSFASFTLYGYITDSQCGLLPDGLIMIAQLVELRYCQSHYEFRILEKTWISWSITFSIATAWWRNFIQSLKYRDIFSKTNRAGSNFCTPMSSTEFRYSLSLASLFQCFGRFIFFVFIWHATEAPSSSLLSEAATAWRKFFSFRRFH